MIWFVLLVLWPLAELFVIVELSEAIGFLWVLLLLIVSWPIGWRLIRHQGRAALRRLRDALSAGQAPTSAVVDGTLVLVGAVLLLVPGFITDTIGLLLLLPPTRALARRGVLHNHRSARLNRFVNFINGNAARFGGPGPGPGGYDAESTAADIDDPRLEA
ncbi:MAG TPA: FxsA family protein [Solirubrobacteraceae bacterium]|nr:FxsA family protein [Solirubrobacteraceae bacterium]